MARPTQRSGAGLKRQVSPAIALVVIIAVIVVVFLIAYSGSIWQSLTGKQVRSEDVGAPGEVKSLNDIRRVVGERLGGVDAKPRSGGGLFLLAVSNPSSGLQQGDAILKINGVPVKNPTIAAIETHKIKVGETMNLEVLRGGQTMTVQVTRQASTKAPEEGGGGMGAGGMGRGGR